MNFIILILIIVLALLYAASHVVPIGGIMAFVAAVGLAITLEVETRRRRRRRENAEE